jgi:2-isopropylmalate synthase
VAVSAATAASCARRCARPTAARAATAAACPSIQAASAAQLSDSQAIASRTTATSALSKTERGHTLYGAGIDTNIELASIKAIVSALNRTLTN